MINPARTWFTVHSDYRLEWGAGTTLTVTRLGKRVGVFKGETRAGSLEMARDHCVNVEAERFGG